ncbi:coiled-coil domain-containing protein 91 [Platysternon megacephalum]|uniref:Coiled-coil domain-containing protein 91 n=1 Tax=Platysternon megacephalum TaxID=55544 RepID=A0A4D9E8Z3_9SAUR|nr:coiled-coil domain-containing protein 91 [Platysternon megacephalum]
MNSMWVWYWPAGRCHLLNGLCPLALIAASLGGLHALGGVAVGLSEPLQNQQPKAPNQFAIKNENGCQISVTQPLITSLFSVRCLKTTTQHQNHCTSLEQETVTNHFVPNNLVQLVHWLEHSKPWRQKSAGEDLRW